jgi:hypothetical protein
MLFTHSKFVKNEYNIPNMPASEYAFVDTDVIYEGWDGKKVKRPGRALIKSSTGQVVFKVRTEMHWPEIQDYDEDLVKEIIPNYPHISHKDSCYLAVIDELYNKYNVTPIGTKSGNLFKKSVNELARRYDQSGVYNTNSRTKVIKDALQALILAAVRGENVGMDENSIEFYQACDNKIDARNTHFIKICFVTKEIHNWRNINRHVVNGQVVCVSAGHTPRELGYIPIDGSNNWIGADQFMWNNVAYRIGTPMVTCPCCEQEVPIEGFNHNEGECDICASATYDIKSYSTRAPQLLGFKAKKVKPDTLYLGVELEFETKDRDAARHKVGKALRGHAIMKSDGSIHNGFEVVTCPATLDIQLEVFKKFYDTKITELKNASNVGMHVHVSRKPLSVLTVGKLTAFMNNRDNVDFITAIAGRKPNSYCRVDEYRKVSFPLTNSGGGDRYNTLNLQNKETIEFRIFSTPLNYEEFASKVQFCQALVEYCKPAVMSAPLDIIKNYKTFVGWLSTQRKSYPELSAKLKGVA